MVLIEIEDAVFQIETRQEIVGFREYRLMRGVSLESFQIRVSIGLRFAQVRRKGNDMYEDHDDDDDDGDDMRACLCVSEQS